MVDIVGVQAETHLLYPRGYLIEDDFFFTPVSFLDEHGLHCCMFVDRVRERTRVTEKYLINTFIMVPLGVLVLF